VRNEEVLQRVKKERDILQTVERKKANWIGQILCRNCLLTRDNKRKIEGRRGIRRKQLLDDIKKNREY
jgi:hypothetical protein